MNSLELIQKFEDKGLKYAQQFADQIADSWSYKGGYAHKDESANQCVVGKIKELSQELIKEMIGLKAKATEDPNFQITAIQLDDIALRFLGEVDNVVRETDNLDFIFHNIVRTVIPQWQTTLQTMRDASTHPRRYDCCFEARMRLDRLESSIPYDELYSVTLRVLGRGESQIEMAKQECKEIIEDFSKKCRAIVDDCAKNIDAPGG